jgi:asparagine synthase (glutamine-hydrolysing)
MRRRISGSAGRELASSMIDTQTVRRFALADRFDDIVHARRWRSRRQRLDHLGELESAVVPLGMELLDYTAAGAGVELRHPFMDRELVEFCLGLPPEQKLHDGWSRYILRTGLEGILPEQIRWRGGKSSLAANFRWTLGRYERERILRVISEAAEVIEPYYDMEAVRSATRRFSDGSATATEEIALWKAAVLGGWIRSRPR